MSYTVLARKYRPQTFADLVGQEHVSRTLGNAIEGGRVAHAFLFTGSRGVGKTTTARLLAKALNCQKGPTATPCNECDACRQIATGVDLDVLEIDGASNNGVDDVRRLQETLPFRPARDRFKIVIVDEVHMLSTGAFNAFLKTLEEPPSHVKFIFATTEAHKVPITIRSRCQRYDFRLIPHGVVAARVREILALEEIEADDNAIALVTREAAGSMRDALTVLDQLLALGGTSLYGESVARGLGIASRDHVFDTIAALLAGDAAECLRKVSAIVEQGVDILHFAKQLLGCARDLVVLRVVGEADSHVELAPDELARAKQLAETRERPELERLFAGMAKLVEEVAEAGLPHMTLEMGLVRLADRPALVALQDLVGQLKALEERLAGAGPRGGGPAPGSRTPPTRGPVAGPAPDLGGAQGGRARAMAQPVSAPVAGPIDEARAPVMPAQAARVEPAPSAATKPTDPAPNTATKPHEPVSTVTPDVAAPVAANATQPPAAATQAASDATAHAQNDVLAPPSVAADRNNADPWTRIVGQIKVSQPALGAVLDHGMPLEVTRSILRVGFPEGSFFGRQAQSTAARDAILRAAEQVLGARPEFSVSVPGAAKVSTLAEAEEVARSTRRAARREAALRHPSVVDAMEVFEESESSVDIHVDLE